MNYCYFQFSFPVLEPALSLEVPESSYLTSCLRKDMLDQDRNYVHSIGPVERAKDAKRYYLNTVITNNTRNHEFHHLNNI
jgi:hypothetical protein